MGWKKLSDGIAQARREMAAREKRPVDQQEIADAIGVSVAAYSRWELGKREPRDEAMVEKLAKFFGVTPAYLRYGITAPDEPETIPVDAFEEMPAPPRKRARPA